MPKKIKLNLEDLIVGSFTTIPKYKLMGGAAECSWFGICDTDQQICAETWGDCATLPCDVGDGNNTIA